LVTVTAYWPKFDEANTTLVPSKSSPKPICFSNDGVDRGFCLNGLGKGSFVLTLISLFGAQTFKHVRDKTF
jgi:hypothetical protein